MKRIQRSSGLSLLGVLAPAVISVLLPISIRAQDSQFVFDAPGNLISQTTETSSSPQIVGQPQMQVVQPGARATFSVVALDTSGLSYQWLFFGTNLPGQTADALQISNVSSNNEGFYSVRLANSSGSITSNPAALWLDSRGCGMPDWWQRYYFTNLNQNASADFDGDGVSNLQEFLDGTNPTNRASVRFRLSIISYGSTITATPSLLSYSNGDTVTISATPIPPFTFRGWGGDAFGTNNPVALTMTNNRTAIAYAGAFSITWTNTSNGDWNTASNWYPNLVPDASDNVLITSSVTVSSSNSVECAGLTLGAPGFYPTLAISGNLTLDGASHWVSGAMSGAGSIIVRTGAVLNIENPSTTIALSGCTLENNGTVLWLGPSYFSISSAIISNAPAGVFVAQNTTSLDSASSRFDNAGSLRKTASSGTTTLNIPFNNFGSVDIQSGTLLWGKPFTNNGTVSIESGATNNLAAGGTSTGSLIAQPGSLAEWTSGFQAFILNPGAQLSGLGSFRLDGSTLHVNADLSVQNLDLVTTFSGPVATLDGIGALTISNLMNWTSGTLAGTGRTIIAPGATLNIASSFSVTLTRTLENGGTVLWAGPAALNVNNAIITNRAGALFNVQAAGSLGGSGAEIDNAGIFRKTVNTGATVLANLNNLGTIDIQAGTLSCNGPLVNNGVFQSASGTSTFISNGGSTSGSFNAAAGAIVVWTGGPFTPVYTLNPGAQLNGAGLYRLDGAKFYLNGDLQVQNFDLVLITGANQSSLNGTGVVTVANVMNWLYGDQSGSGRTVIAPGASLNLGSSGTVFLNRNLENAGTVLSTGANLDANGTVITNRSGALFNLQGVASVSGSGSRLDNAGTLRKSVGAATSTVGVTFNNYGLVDIQTGMLVCNNGAFVNYGSVTLAPGTTNQITAGGSSSGVFNAAGTALVQWIGTAFTPAFALNPGAQLYGKGIYRVDGTTLTFNTDISVQNIDLLAQQGSGSTAFSGTGSLTISNTMNWLTGTVGASGNMLIAPGALLSLANSVSLNRNLENAGTILWTGSGITLGGGVITNRQGSVFEAQNSANLNGSGRLDNAGTFRKSVNSGTTSLPGVPFNNYGTVDLQIGTLAPNSGFSSASTALLNCGLGGTNYGRLQLPGAITLNGNLSVYLLAGYSPATNDTFTVVSAGSRSGTFANFSYPSNRVALTLSNAPSSVLLRVVGVSPVPQPTMLMPQLVGSNVLLSWTAISNVYYRLESVPSLSSNNWTAVAGDVTTFSNTASKLDNLRTSNQFYRVHVLP